ncbi:YihY/virulence factor BrkB family protein [Aminicella lysinilytica]|uniref:YihY/virulence factor BrkB family protein n=1 Tax=Aminicella lysinilytica TaxID=433323 RepID=UPI0026EA96F1|nr:YihY/virulence factor BrkB family protein [Aminicella lysinilytica]
MMERFKDRLKRMVVLGFRQFGDPYYQGFAAQIAFFIMLSLVPTIIVISQLLGVINASMDFINTWVEKYVHSSMANTLEELLGGRSSVAGNIGNNVVMILMALWAASRAQFSMMRIANYTYSGGRTTGNFWKERFRSIRTMFLTILTYAFVIIILIYGEKISIIVFGHVIEDSLIIKLWTYFRWPLAAVLYFLVVLYNYYVLPIERMSLRDIVPGSLFGAAGMVIVTFFYSIYVDYIVHYNLIYGSLSSIVALLFWFYFLAWALALGILFNKVWKDTRGVTSNGSY